MIGTTPIQRCLSAFDTKGRCGKCKRSWKYVEHMPDITYEEYDGRGSAGAFPLCTECYEDASAWEVTHYFARLVDDKWDRYPTFEELQTFRRNVARRKRRAERDDDHDGIRLGPGDGL